MSDQILVNYEEVYSKTAELRQRIRTELIEMDTAYRRCQAELRNMDGKTNAEFIETLAENQRKARVTADTLQKLLAFIENSARQVERNDQMFKRAFNSSRMGVRRRGGISNA